jgi:hypothetical protein
MRAMSTLETLKAARKLIENESAYTILVATDSYGDITSPSSPDTARWGMDGAIVKITGGTNNAAFEEAAYAISSTLPGRANISMFVRNHTHDEVLRAFDEAIAKLENQ